MPQTQAANVFARSRENGSSIKHASLTLFLCAVILATLGSTNAWAGKYNRDTDVGQKMEAWSDLPGVDGKTYSSSTFDDAKAVAIIFTCNHCPVANSYMARLKQIAADYADQPFAIVAINVNKGETLESMKQHAADNDLTFPYLRDESQATAKQLGAKCTPHAYLLDSQRKIAYMGAIDDNWQSTDGVSESYLRDAIEAVLSDKTPSTAESKQVGCGIRWR